MAELPRLVGITIIARHIESVAAAYQTYLGLEVRARGTLPGAVAAAWGDAALGGAPWISLAATGDGAHFIRLLERADALAYRPFGSPGWAAAEIIVDDCDSLVDALDDPPFTVHGEPAELSFTDAVRSAQVVGPADELLYLAEVRAAVPGVELPLSGAAPVHCCVAALGATDLSESRIYYRDRLGLDDAPVFDARVKVMSECYGLEVHAKHSICALPLAPGYLLEIDQLPPGTHTGHDPAPTRQGLALVTLEVDDIGALADPGTAYADAALYGGRPAAVMRGPDGEILELAQRPAP